jgi:hypothetical protein
VRFLVVELLGGRGSDLVSDLEACLLSLESVFGLADPLLGAERFCPGLPPRSPDGLAPSTLVEALILPLVPAGMLRSANRCSELE